MNIEVEKRLHRVMIKLTIGYVKCPYSKQCTYSEICNRCNIYYDKCSIFIEKYSKLHNLVKLI